MRPEVLTMKAYERRELGAYPYYKLSTWDARSFAWRAAKVTQPTEAEARAAARKPGRYRIEKFEESTSYVLEPFEV